MSGQTAADSLARSPRIGIPGVPQDGAIRVEETYLTAIHRAGGLSLILPPALSPEQAAEVAALLDGLLIPGGPGITAGLVGDLPDDLPPVDSRRWASDVAYFQAMQARQRPILGICYGMQLINALHGGTIYGDVMAQRERTHPHTTRRGADAHPVQALPGTHLAALIGTDAVPANSFHIQAVLDAGEGLRINARSDDGVIEGIESADGHLLGLQCHPERLPDDPWPGVFAAFVRRCTGA